MDFLAGFAADLFAAERARGLGHEDRLHALDRLCLRTENPRRAKLRTRLRPILLLGLMLKIILMLSIDILQALRFA